MSRVALRNLGSWRGFTLSRLAQDISVAHLGHGLSMLPQQSLSQTLPELPDLLPAQLALLLLSLRIFALLAPGLSTLIEEISQHRLRASVVVLLQQQTHEALPVLSNMCWCLLWLGVPSGTYWSDGSRTGLDGFL